MPSSSPTDEPNVVHEPWPFTSCPACDACDFLAAPHGGDVIFTCLSCHAAWRYALGFLTEVSPES